MVYDAIRNNKDLLTLKILDFQYENYFYSSINIIYLRLVYIIFANPLTASMSKYYEKTKSNYSRDIDHLVTFNENGLWIREKLDDDKELYQQKNQVVII